MFRIKISSILILAVYDLKLYTLVWRINETIGKPSQTYNNNIILYYNALL